MFFELGIKIVYEIKISSIYFATQKRNLNYITGAKQLAKTSFTFDSKYR